MSKPLYEQNNNWEEILNQGKEKDIKLDAEREGGKAGVQAKKTSFDFDIKPEELESFLNKYVVGQEDAIEVIATKVCTHFNRMKIEHELPEDEKIVGNIKSNMLMIGPTGVGKTYIIKLIAKKIGVPFVKADATKFSETGYVGGDVEDLVRELVHEADGDISRAEYGIIYIDEIDKIASSTGLSGPDVSRTGVQRNLLKLMEESDVDLKTPHDLASQVEAAMEAQRTGHVTRKKINTRNILFIVSGAFSDLDTIISKRLNLQAIGFESKHAGALKQDDMEFLKQIKTEDLLKYGFESEFIGRLPVTVILNNITVESLFQILKNSHSAVVNGKKMDFKAYGISLSFTDDALKIIAERAYEEKTGARGLLSVVEKILICFEKTLPSIDIKELEVDAVTVENPKESLKKLLVNDSIKHFQKDFLVKHNIYLDFDKKAVESIQEMASKEHKSFKRICEDLFHDYAYGIRLMKLDKFTIPEEAVKDPKKYLDDYIVKNFQKE